MPSLAKNSPVAMVIIKNYFFLSTLVLSTQIVEIFKKNPRCHGANIKTNCNLQDGGSEGWSVQGSEYELAEGSGGCGDQLYRLRLHADIP
jgi:hypothetical protein